MSDPAAPWWAEVQHLRPREDAAPAPRRDAAPARASAPRTSPRRFDRSAHEELESAALATLEHEVPDPFAPSEPTPDRPVQRGTTSEWTVDAPATTAWDPAIEEAFDNTPSWSDEVWLMPKGADRIENGRRTIEIRGQVDRIHGFNAVPEPPSMAQRARRPGRRPGERFERRPDRVAMWAFLLGVLLILIAALSQPGDADAAAAAVSQLALL